MQKRSGWNSPILVKYFNPCGVGTWLITEIEKLDDGDCLLYGLCHIFEPEWGYVLLSELMSVKLPYGLTVEKDLHLAKGTTVREEAKRLELI